MGEIRFVGACETRGYPYLVCKKEGYVHKQLQYAHLKIDKYHT